LTPLGSKSEADFCLKGILTITATAIPDENISLRPNIKVKVYIPVIDYYVGYKRYANA
jgi:hypothetical protein